MIRTKETRPGDNDLSASEIIYHDLFDLNPQPMWVYDVDTLKILAVNQAAIQHYGYKKDEFLALTHFDLIADMGRPAPERPGFSGGPSRHRKKGGREIDVRMMCKSVQFSGKNAELVVCNDVTALSAAERERNIATERLRDAQKIANIGYWRRAIGETLLEWSPEMFEIYGRNPHTFSPTCHNLAECFHPDDRHLLADDIPAGLYQRAFLDFKHRIVTEKGEVKWVFQRLQLEKDEYGNAVALKGIIQDITDKCKADEKLIEKEHRFKALVQEGADLIAILDESGKYGFASESSLPILGIRCEELIGKSIFNYIHTEDISIITTLLGRLGVEKQVTSEPFRFRDKKGEFRWMRMIATNLSDDPAVKGIVTNSRDITEMVMKNQALLLSNERYRMILKAANEAVYDWDIRRNVIEWGSGFQEIFGYDLSAADNRLWEAHIFEEDKARVQCQTSRAKEDKETEILVYECRYIKAGGEVAQVEHRIIFMRDEHGNAIRAVGSVKDITDYRQNLLKIKLQNEKLREIAWAQSHIVRAPLARMMGLMDLLNMGDSGSMSQADILGHIRSSAEELDLIIRDIVSKAKPSWVAN